MPRALLRILVTSLILSGPALAEDDLGARFTERMWRPELLLTLSAGPSLLPADLDLELPPPPGPHRTQDELDRLEMIYTPLRDDRSRRLIVLEAEAAATDLLEVYGLIPSQGQSPDLWALLELTGSEVTWFVLREKRKHERARPTQIRPSIGSVIPVPGHPSYPSGHAAQIYALTGLLGRILPECAGAYRRVAAGVAIRREIAGVHFPSDTAGGVELADRVVSRLLVTPQVSVILPAVSEHLRAHASVNGCVGSAVDGRGGER